MPRESLENKKKRVAIIFRQLKEEYPKAGMILRYSNNWELTVAVILSAQCTDKKVNEVTEKLFQKYPTLDDYVDADIKEFEQDIFQTGFYRTKTKNILAAAKLIKNHFDGEIPKTMEEMLELPGVARKTANVVLGNAYNIVEGIAVDTHVKRVANRLGLTKESSPVKIEQDLMKIIPQTDWFRGTYLFIDHGRAICDAKKPACNKCPLSDICPSAFDFPECNE